MFVVAKCTLLDLKNKGENTVLLRTPSSLARQTGTRNCDTVSVRHGVTGRALDCTFKRNGGTRKGASEKGQRRAHKKGNA